jgi:hypothetical protein
MQMLLIGGTFLSGASAFAIALNRLIRGHYIDLLEGNSTNIIEGHAITTNPICLNNNEYIICVDKTYYRTVNNDNPIFVCKTIQYNDNVFIHISQRNERSETSENESQKDENESQRDENESQKDENESQKDENESQKINVWQYISTMPLEPIDVTVDNFSPLLKLPSRTICEKDEIPITHIEHRFYGIKNNTYFTIFHSNEQRPIVTYRTKAQHITELQNQYNTTNRYFTGTLILGLGIIGMSIFLKPGFFKTTHFFGNAL